ncbi:DsbA family oxidoreductase [Natronosporangium hydrolyticum]|uniref:DsbA family oxidoreductase n=1 Tax=Natronosporangium hydrolyticum TaxID=2811111 RepID=A0A895YP90_9ACTN|nr:DsbA family oxidoreductase [Natronosporangium hydrolyticum]QSB16536.1 DsbA family oxidoreductase [Natronosporangium hydrolyticum]
MLDVMMWADIRCPWCWIGLRRLQVAAKEIPGGLRVRHRSFLLEPAGPASPGRLVADIAVSEWGMTAEQWRAKSAAIRAQGRQEGLDIRIDTTAVVDSRPAHRLLHAAADNGVDPTTAWEAAFDAHLRRNVDLADPAALLDLADQIGLPRPAVRSLLAGEDYADAVVADHQAAVSRGIHGVPTIVAGDHTLTGSRSVAELGDFLMTAGSGQ